MQVDEELNRIKQVTDQIRTSLTFLQRDDFALADQSVGFDQLRPEILIGINPPSAWSTTKNYIARDTVFTNSNFYICLESHVSGVFDDDLAAGKWELIASFEAATSANSVTFDDTSAGLGANLVQTAIAALKTNADALQGTVASLDATQISYDATGRTNTDAAHVQEAVDDLDGALASASPRWHEPGDLKWSARQSPSAGWLFCNGAAVSRTTYAALFDAIGTTFGVGDGTTTFNLPDGRGRVPAGRDDMGGVDAGRLSGVFGSIARVLGGVLGAASHVLTLGQMPKHWHNATFTGNALPPHTHGGVLKPTSGLSIGASGANAGTGSTDSASAGVPSGTVSVDFAGGDQAHPNAQPTLILNLFIKT